MTVVREWSEIPSLDKRTAEWPIQIRLTNASDIHPNMPKPAQAQKPVYVRGKKLVPRKPMPTNVASSIASENASIAELNVSE
jgi:hypothetical protein